MNISKFIFGIAIFVVYIAFSGTFVRSDVVAGRNKTVKPVVPVGGHVGKGHGPDEVTDADVHHALEELKVLTSAVSKKTQENKSIVIGSTLANVLFLTVIAALVGYNMKDNKKKKGDDTEDGGSN